MVRTRGLGRQAINALSITNSILPGRQSVEELEKSHAETNTIQHTTKPMVTIEILSDLFNAEFVFGEVTAGTEICDMLGQSCQYYRKAEDPDT